MSFQGGRVNPLRERERDLGRGEEGGCGVGVGMGVRVSCPAAAGITLESPYTPQKGVEYTERKKSRCVGCEHRD